MNAAHLSQLTRPTCRNCGHSLNDWTPQGDEAKELVFADLGNQPLANNFLSAADLRRPEVSYPLKVLICPHCTVVQVPSTVPVQDIYGDYAYFSSQSVAWLRHCDEIVAAAIEDGVGPFSQVLEVASNDGALLRAFARKDIPAVGIEPAANVATHAILHGAPTFTEFFTSKTAVELADTGYRPDLIVATNVFCHVPSWNDFVTGVDTVMEKDGKLLLEYPNLDAMFDTEDGFGQIYHEHLAYLDEWSTRNIFLRRGMNVTRMEQIPVHGGSLRVWVERGERANKPWPPIPEGRLERLLSFADKPARFKQQFLRTLISLKTGGQSIYGYGAAAKGVSVLNYAGIKRDLIEGIFDSTPAKVGRFTPGGHIPILHESLIKDKRPEVLVLLAPNWKAELVEKLRSFVSWPMQVVTGTTVENIGEAT